MIDSSLMMLKWLPEFHFLSADKLIRPRVSSGSVISDCGKILLFGCYIRSCEPSCESQRVLEFFRAVTASIVIAVEAGGASPVSYGAEALYVHSSNHSPAQTVRRTQKKSDCVSASGCWEFHLVADRARTAVSPTWQDIGQFAALGAIRTFLSFFLQRDLNHYHGLGKRAETKAIRPIAVSRLTAQESFK